MGIAGDLVLVLLAGLAGGVVARLLGLPLLVGYVAAGTVIGPHTAGPTVGNVGDVELLAELGVALLLFAIGLEVNLRDLGPVRRVAVFGGAIQISLTTALGAFAFRGLVGASWSESIWMGAMVSMSSTMVVLKVLSSDGTLGTLASRVMIGTLIVQDLAVAPMLIVLPHVGALGEGSGAALRAIGIAAAFLTGIIVIGARILPALLRRIIQSGSRELFLVAVVAAGVGVGYLTYALGFSFALGAFVAGLVLSESELSHQALSDVVPIRDVFALVFFVSVGMLLDPRALVENGALVAAIVATVILGKALVCGWVARAFGYVNMAPWLVGLGLAQIGEFGFVLARAGFSGGYLSQRVYDLALTSTVLSMTLSPVVFRAAIPLGRAWLRRHPPRRPAPTTTPVPVGLEGHAIVGGYGRTGRAVVAALRAAAVPVVVVELNHQMSTAAANDGVDVVWGDLASETILNAARVTQATMLIIALPDWPTVRLGIHRARALNPSLHVVARASTSRHLADLSELGVQAAVQPEFEGGVEMMRQALRHLDRPEPEIEGLANTVRRDLYGERGS